MDLNLNGKKAILVGATKGIGRAVAETLVSEGCSVAICARDPKGVDMALTELNSKPSGDAQVIGASVDMTDVGAYLAWIKTAAETLGGCDIFVCFGSGGGAPASEDQWKSCFELDLLATYRGIEAALPFLEESKNASIVVISTIVVSEPAFGPQPYAAMKAAITNYASALSKVYAAKGIRVNSVSPGPVFFEDGDWDRIKQNRPELYDKIMGQIPLGRLGEGQDIAKSVAFLASPASAYTTGANLVIDGGMTRRVQY